MQRLHNRTWPRCGLLDVLHNPVPYSNEYSVGVSPYVYCEMEAYQNVTLGLIPFYTLNLYIKRLEMIEWKILFLVGAVADPNLGQKRNHLAVTDTPAFWTSFAWHEPQISKSLEKKLTETKNVRDHREYHPHNESMLHDVLQWLFDWD